jgi:hypothetical protein
MGLIARIQQRLHAWTWRLRYWWMDTESGLRAQVTACAIGAIACVLDLIHMAVVALAPRPAGQPAKAIIWWVAYIIVALVAAAIAYAMRPKVQQQPQKDPEGPTTEDGQAVIRYWGTHWIDDTFQLAWKVVGRDPIKAKGGK